jgi:ribonuclease P protein component
MVRAKPNGLAHARLGMIAGRKAMPRAVDRNRCKRLVREVFRAARPMLAALDVVVFCRRAVTAREKAAGRQELAQLFAAVSGFGGNRSAARAQ